MLQLINTNTTALTAGQTIPVSIEFNTCRGDVDYNATTNQIIFRKSGTYEVVGNFTFTPTDAGNVSISAQTSSTAIPGMIETNTATAGSTIGYTVSKVLRIVTVNGSYATLNYIVSAAGNLNNALIYVKKA